MKSKISFSRLAIFQPVQHDAHVDAFVAHRFAQTLKALEAQEEAHEG